MVYLSWKRCFQLEKYASTVLHQHTELCRCSNESFNCLQLFSISLKALTDDPHQLKGTTWSIVPRHMQICHGDQKCKWKLRETKGALYYSIQLLDGPPEGPLPEYANSISSFFANGDNCWSRGSFGPGRGHLLQEAPSSKTSCLPPERGAPETNASSVIFP